MGNSNSVRPSRDGDQFHYLWAARQCLRLLSSTDNLVAISIEGPSAQELESAELVEDGVDQIDVGEYYGSENLKEATFVRYIQLKHSTTSPTKPWYPSELEKTIGGFSGRYQKFEKHSEGDDFIKQFEFWFISNRPINSKLLETVEDAALGRSCRDPGTLKKLEKYTSLNGERLSVFCKLLKLDGGHDSYWLQRTDLVRETNGYLPGNDVDAPVQLKELVTRKALSESTLNPSITKIDVLRALGTTEDDIFPVPSRIVAAEKTVPRIQEVDLVAKIVNSHTPVILHAEGGVGKSVLSQRIELHLPKDSVAVVYDCFGNGEYRRPGSPRHRHKDALVQIANELAALGLCDPLIPSSNADNADYLKAFNYRAKQSITSINAQNEQAILCLIIDAADNAEMAAKEFGDERSFVRDLLREPLLDRVRLVVLCRTERQDYLEPSSDVLRLELKPFTKDETAVFLRETYTDASENDVDEFHKLTSCNPRVQANVLAESGPLSKILRSLGPDFTTVDDIIAAQLNKVISELRERAGNTEQPQIDSICAALAILRPLIPVTVLESISGVSASMVRSFATDFGRPLLVIGDTVQFRDEPVETWFRYHFKPDAEQLTKFICKLKPLALESTYIASTLPQLMLEAGQLSELIELALFSSSLPTTNPIEKRDVEVQRLQFALKASLREERFVDAAKLALKAAQETTGDTRQQTLLQDNTDIAAVFTEPEHIQEIVSRKKFGSGWNGSHHVYEAGLLSYISEFRSDARSRLRMAYEWLGNWCRLPEEEREKEEITEKDIAEIALIRFNIDGPETCANELRRWTPSEVSYEVGLLIAQRLVDHELYDDLNRLALAANDNMYLLLAINIELRAVHRSPPKETIERALCLLRNKRLEMGNSQSRDNETALHAIIALVESAHSHKLGHPDDLIFMLEQYLPEGPPRGLASRFNSQRIPFLQAHALRAILKGENLQLVDLAHPDIRHQLENREGLPDSHDLQEFKQHIGAFLQWHKLRADNILAPKSPCALATEIAEACQKSTEAQRITYREESFISNEIAEIWFEILTSSSGNAESLLEEFKTWAGNLARPLYVRTWIRLARLAARTSNFEYCAYDFAQRAFQLARDAGESAEYKAQTYVELARALLSKDKSEAGEYFNQAIEVASKIGDEILDRWSAMLDLADRAADSSRPCPKTAYEFSRCAELAHEYTYDHFNWGGTVTAIAGLCPSSCLAILSRWRDRNFGESKRLLTRAISVFYDHENIDLTTVSALIGFRANWQYSELLKKMFKDCTSHSDREKVLSHFLRYMRLDEQSSSTWEEFKKMAEEDALFIPDIDRLIEYTKLYEGAIGNANSSYDNLQLGQNIEFNWDSVFLDLDLYTSNGLSDAYTNFKSNKPPFYPEIFFSELFKRIPVGKEAQLIQAFFQDPDFNLYHTRNFLEQLPEDWRTRMSIRSCLRDEIEKLCRRHSMEITKNRYYQLFPLELASDLAQTTEEELISTVVSSIGERAEILGADKLFTLIGLLASQLSHREALDALNFGIGLFDNVLKEGDGDGPWTDVLAPLSDINAALAGYIWAALAAPQANLRWEAAHAVRGLCTFGKQAILDHLVELAKGREGGPFVDKQLHFYHLHGQQWLMIALARAASENPGILASHSDFFIHHALEDEPHVVIRHFAAKVVLILTESGFLELDENSVDKLANVNRSEFPVVKSKQHQRLQHLQDEEDRKNRFRFDYDMSRYWFERLGICFAKNISYIEVEAEKVICDDWQLSQDDRWERDVRHRRGYFRNQETHHSHGSYPRVDDLEFYLSYHAMMIVAGKLLARTPYHQDPDDPEDKFEYWLKSHLLSRQDGYWLADRRDPKPLQWPSWKGQKQEDDWSWSVCPSDFSRFLNADNDRLNLWGDWNTVFGQREEKVRINSALVAPQRSAALLAALQTITNPYWCRLPDADSDVEIDDLGFKLKGWVDIRTSDMELDEFDPWGGGIRYPPLKPAKFVRDLFQLKEDRECRVWEHETKGGYNEVLWSQVWADKYRQHDEAESERGYRLQASRIFVNEFLGKMNMELVVVVNIERCIRRSYYEGSKDDNFRHALPYFKIFILSANGQMYSL